MISFAFLSSFWRKNYPFQIFQTFPLLNVRKSGGNGPKMPKKLLVDIWMIWKFSDIFSCCLKPESCENGQKCPWLICRWSGKFQKLFWHLTDRWIIDIIYVWMPSCFAPFFNYDAFIFQFSLCRAARLTFNQISSKQMRQIVTKKAKQNNSLHRRYLICQCNKRVKNRKHLDIKDKFG